MMFTVGVVIALGMTCVSAQTPSHRHGHSSNAAWHAYGNLMTDLGKFLMKTGLVIGLLLMLVAGVAFVVSLLLAAESGTREQTFTRTELFPVLIVSAAVFILALVLTVFSGILAWKGFGGDLKEREKWKKRL